jgi:hypothetical protein
VRRWWLIFIFYPLILHAGSIEKQHICLGALSRISKGRNSSIYRLAEKHRYRTLIPEDIIRYLYTRCLGAVQRLTCFQVSADSSWDVLSLCHTSLACLREENLAEA